MIASSDSVLALEIDNLGLLLPPATPGYMVHPSIGDEDDDEDDDKDAGDLETNPSKNGAGEKKVFHDFGMTFPTAPPGGDDSEIVFATPSDEMNNSIYTLIQICIYYLFIFVR